MAGRKGLYFSDSVPESHRVLMNQLEFLFNGGYSFASIECVKTEHPFFSFFLNIPTYCGR